MASVTIGGGAPMTPPGHATVNGRPCPADAGWELVEVGVQQRPYERCPLCGVVNKLDQIERAR